MKFILSLFLLLSSINICKSNMASPYWDGTRSGSPFSSKDIDITKEKIEITLDKNFKNAFFKIEYHIKCDSDGNQIPLLFHALQYDGDFKVWIDDKEIQLIEFPYSNDKVPNFLSQKFLNVFKTPENSSYLETVTLDWGEPYGTHNYSINDFKYFKVDVSKGEHLIKVEYNATVWTDASDWINRYSFRYSLAPAKQWRSFGTLEIILNNSGFDQPFTTNLGTPTDGKLISKVNWLFHKIPADFITIDFNPEITKLASVLIAIHPSGIMLLFGFLLALAHFFTVRLYRKKNPTIKFSWVMISGSVINPFLILLMYPIAYSIIGSAIGEHEGRGGGYSFLMVFLYPAVLPVYWILMWQIDRYIKYLLNRPPQ